MQPSTLLLRIFVYALAVYRLTHLFVYERGPFDVFDWIRAKAGIRVHTIDPASDSTLTIAVVTVTTKEGFWAELLTCPLCLSMWFAFAATPAIIIASPFVDFFAVWFAIAGLVTICFKVVGTQ